MAEKKGELHYVPYIVFNNLLKCITSSQLAILEDSLYNPIKSITVDSFIKHFQFYGYIQIEARDDSNKQRRFRSDINATNRKRPIRTIFILLDINSNYIQSSADLVKLFTHISGLNQTKRNFNLNIILV